MVNWHFQIEHLFPVRVAMRGHIVPNDGQAIVIDIEPYQFQAWDALPSRTNVIQQRYAELIDMPEFEAPAVWIVDDDLGFVWWLGEIFIQARCRAFPALSCDQALALMKKLNVGADLVLVNPHLRGVSSMLETLNRTNCSLKVVTLQDPSELSALHKTSAITLERPSQADRLSRAEWLKRIRKLLKQVDVAAPRRK